MCIRDRYRVIKVSPVCKIAWILRQGLDLYQAKGSLQQAQKQSPYQRIHDNVLPGFEIVDDQEAFR